MNDTEEEDGVAVDLVQIGKLAEGKENAIAAGWLRAESPVARLLKPTHVILHLPHR
jgi:hypothetical protein